jgi:hypothetical protein
MSYGKAVTGLWQTDETPGLLCRTSSVNVTRTAARIWSNCLNGGGDARLPGPIAEVVTNVASKVSDAYA